MESLVRSFSGSRDIAIGISGFGSARVGADRWVELGAITGRTTYFLRYDAQEFPDSFDLSWSTYSHMMDLWSSARASALLSSDYLASWIEKMVSSKRKVLLVGFSLGGFVAWNAILKLSDQSKASVDVVFLSGALPDRPGSWRGFESVHGVVNVFSRTDMVLKYLYPQAVSSDESPAAGLGPLCIQGSHISNIDITDLMGSDHLWGSSNFHRLICLSVPLLVKSLAFTPCESRDLDIVKRSSVLSLLAIQRLWRWTFVDPDLHAIFLAAIDGDVDSASFMSDVDSWSMESSRLSTLLEISSASVDFSSCRIRGPADRSLGVIRGLLSSWISTDPRLLRHRTDTKAV